MMTRAMETPVRRTDSAAMSYPSNRDRKMEPRHGKGFCACDSHYGRSGRKCPLCGRLMKRRRLKKTPPP